MEMKTSLLRLLVIAGLAFLTESSEIEGSGDDDNHQTCDALREIFQREMARHEEQIVKLKEQNDELKEQNDKLKERNARLEQNRNDEVQQDKQLQELRREEAEVLRQDTSQINRSIRQRDSSGLTVEFCRKNADKMQKNLAKNEEDKRGIQWEKRDILQISYRIENLLRSSTEKLAKKEEENEEISKEIKECGVLVEQSRTRLVEDGRLEVKINGTWGTVCHVHEHHGWGPRRRRTIAQVVCKSLGFSKGLYKEYPLHVKRDKDTYRWYQLTFAAKEVPIFMDYVVWCNGNERSIHDCHDRYPKSKSEYHRGTCARDLAKYGAHTTDVFIKCDARWENDPTQ